MKKFLFKKVYQTSVRTESLLYLSQNHSLCPPSSARQKLHSKQVQPRQNSINIPVLSLQRYLTGKARTSVFLTLSQLPAAKTKFCVSLAKKWRLTLSTSPYWWERLYLEHSTSANTGVPCLSLQGHDSMPGEQAEMIWHYCLFSTQYLAAKAEVLLREVYYCAHPWLQGPGSGMFSGGQIGLKTDSP